MKVTRPSVRRPCVRGLAMSCSSAPMRNAVPRVSSSDSGSRQQRRHRLGVLVAERRRRVAAASPRPRRAPRACARRRRGGGSGSAAPRAARRARAGSPRSRRAGRAAPTRPSTSSAASTRRSSAKMRSAEPRRRARAPPGAPRAAVLGLGLQAELHGEAHEAQHPQRIVGEGRRAGGPQAAGRQVRHAAEGIDQLAAAERLGDGVDREVAQSQVGLQRAAAQRAEIDLPAVVACDDPPGAEIIADSANGGAAGAAAERARRGRDVAVRTTSRSSVSRPSSRSRGTPPTIQACGPASAAATTARVPVPAVAGVAHASSRPLASASAPSSRARRPRGTRGERAPTRPHVTS